MVPMRWQGTQYLESILALCFSSLFFHGKEYIRKKPHKSMTKKWNSPFKENGQEMSGKLELSETFCVLRPTGLGVPGSPVKVSATVSGSVRWSARESTVSNRFFKGFWLNTGCGIIFINHSEKTYRDKSAPQRVKPGRGVLEPAEGRSACRAAVLSTGLSLVLKILELIILEMRTASLMAMIMTVTKSVHILDTLA